MKNNGQNNEERIYNLIINNLFQGNTAISFAASFKIPKGSHAGGIGMHSVGTKILVAQKMDSYESIGIDAVATPANDVISQGFKPEGFLLYLQVHPDISDHVINSFCEGINTALKEADIDIYFCRPTITPEILQSKTDERTFYAVGQVLGFRAHQPVNGKSMREGDVVIGLPSTGLHSHGYTIARTTLLSEFNPDAKYNLDSDLDGSKLGNLMLKETKIYVKTIMETLDERKKGELEIHGLANISDQGYRKLARLGNFADVGIYLDNMPKPPLIMRKIQEIEDFPSKFMYSNFNMGIGFCVILPVGHSEKFIEICHGHGITGASRIGYVTNAYGKTVTINTEQGRISFDYKPVRVMTPNL